MIETHDEETLTRLCRQCGKPFSQPRCTRGPVKQYCSGNCWLEHHKLEKRRKRRQVALAAATAPEPETQLALW